MTRLLLIRHGQSQANVEKTFAGHTDSPLSALGLEQAQLTAAYVKSCYQIDRVYASDLQRAFQTGQAVAQKYGITPQPCPALREIYGGDWEGTPYGQLPTLYPDSYGVWLSDIGNAVCDGGESVAQLYDRVVEALLHICRENNGKTVAIATHATPIRAIQCYCQGRPLWQMKDIPWVSNASVTELEFENNSLQIVRLSYDKHLGELTSVLPATC